MIDHYFITTKNILKDKKDIWHLLKDCFWSKNIPIEYIERFLKYSLCFGAYQKINNKLVGFGRVISDYTTYAYICDIVIDEKHRKRGIGSKLVLAMKNHPELKGLKTWSLRTTEEARKIYERNGFKLAENIETLLEINDLKIYSCTHFINLYAKQNEKIK